MIRTESRGAVVRPMLCGLIILASALPFVVVVPRLKGEYAHMNRSDVSVAAEARAASSVEGDQPAPVRDGRGPEASTR